VGAGGVGREEDQDKKRTEVFTGHSI